MIVYATARPDVRTARPLRVDGSVENLEIGLDELRPISGAVHFEDDGAANKPADAKAPTPSLGGIPLFFFSRELQMFGHIPTRTGKDGSIIAKGFPGQTLLLSVTAPRGTWVTRVSQDGKALQGSPWEIAVDGGPVEVLLSRKTGSLSGTVRDGSGNPARAMVVAAPERRDAEHLYRTFATAGDGQYRIEDLPQGKYKMFALQGSEEEAWLDPRYFQPWESKGSDVSVESGTSSSADPVVIDASHPR